jgi:hypothetical protein
MTTDSDIDALMNLSAEEKAYRQRVIEHDKKKIRKEAAEHNSIPVPLAQVPVQLFVEMPVPLSLRPRNPVHLIVLFKASRQVSLFQPPANEKPETPNHANLSPRVCI